MTLGQETRCLLRGLGGITRADKIHLRNPASAYPKTNNK